jgi:hypothetical protein
MPFVYDAPLVDAVEPQEGHVLLVKFDNGEQRRFDLKPLLDLPVFLPLKADEFFRQVEARDGSVVWPSGADLAHDMLYARSEPVAVPTTI